MTAQATDDRTTAPVGGMEVDVQRYAAFAVGNQGGNPAGVVIGAALPTVESMQAVAADVGYSETVFAARQGSEFRVRYYSPEAEVQFCGHATLALGAALADRYGDGIFQLALNSAQITVEGRRTADGAWAALQSPPTSSRAASSAMVTTALDLFSYAQDDLDPRLSPAVAHAGLDHLVIALKDRTALSAMHYDLGAGREFMRREGIGTVSLIYAETATVFHARNPFAIGGVYEDPATGAAAAALAGLLRDVQWPHGGKIRISQGEDMGQPCELVAEITDVAGESIRVSGLAYPMTDQLLG
ncbi:PhzF family phenazine biosynthesis isomerase [Sphingomonas sp. NY01]|uniref:PhzF family phenazine biosynthesis protein n=1 Tax=Sphingomonas sp. NY01 TaxID=2968057 RepID=UPI00315D3A67